MKYDLFKEVLEDLNLEVEDVGQCYYIMSGETLIATVDKNVRGLYSCCSSDIVKPIVEKFSNTPIDQRFNDKPFKVNGYINIKYNIIKRGLDEQNLIENISKEIKEIYGEDAHLNIYSIEELDM